MNNLSQSYEKILDRPDPKDYKAHIYRYGVLSLLSAVLISNEYALVMNNTTLQRMIYRNIPYSFSNTPKIFGITVLTARHMSDDVIAISYCKTAYALATIFNSWQKEAQEYIREVDDQLKEPGEYKINEVLYKVLDMKYKGV